MNAAPAFDALDRPPHLLLVDVTVDAIKPAHAVRVMIPGMESNNPFYAGPRARATAIRDLLPRTTRAATLQRAARKLGHVS
mgnify:CR=1 FL=1